MKSAKQVLYTYYYKKTFRIFSLFSTLQFDLVYLKKQQN